MRASAFELIQKSEQAMGSGMNSKAKALAIELVKRAYHEGIYIKITAGYRSNAEQQRLYNQGRTTPGNIVTNARPGQSIHNYGLAIDYVLVSEDGKSVSWEVNKQWRRVAEIGKQLGFQWGGDWTSFRDYPHLDLQRGMSLSALAKGQRPKIPSVPTRNYLGQGDSGPEVEAMQRYLTQVGFQTDIDGSFGSDTEVKLRAFQLARGIQVDGLYGSGAKDEMNRALKAGQVQTSGNKPEEEIYLDLNTRQNEELAKVYQTAREMGVFSSAEHEQVALEGKMTENRAIYLNALIAGAALNGGKRIK